MTNSVCEDTLADREKASVAIDDARHIGKLYSFGARLEPHTFYMTLEALCFYRCIDALYI